MRYRPDIAEHYLADQSGPADALADLRTKARDRLLTLGLPGRRVEEWKYSDLPVILKNRTVGAKAFGASDKSNLGFDDHQVLIDNGHLVSGAGDLVKAFDPSSVRDNWTGHLGQGDPVTLLNLALAGDGVVIDVPAGQVIDQPVHLIFRNKTDGRSAIHARSQIILGDGAELTIIEDHDGSGDYMLQHGLDIQLGKNARLTHIVRQMAGADAAHLSETNVKVARDGRYRQALFTWGAGFARYDMTVALNDQGAECDLGGAYLLNGRQHCDIRTEVIHAAPHTTSNQLFKGVVGGRGQGVYQGKVAVRPDAQKTDSRQLSKALLLNPGAEADHKPELEIYADDVKCAHGATSGEIDADQLFYLQSRGIPEGVAKRLLITAFLDEVVAGIEGDEALDVLARFLRTDVEEWFEGQSI